MKMPLRKHSAFFGIFYIRNFLFCILLKHYVKKLNIFTTSVTTEHFRTLKLAVLMWLPPHKFVHYVTTDYGEVKKVCFVKTVEVFNMGEIQTERQTRALTHAHAYRQTHRQPAYLICIFPPVSGSQVNKKEKFMPGESCHSG
jgi:hypothetical protein